MSNELKGRTALVTGASSGLGVDFARELAARGCDVILVARRAEALRAVAAQIAADFGVRADTVVSDLGAAAAREQLHAELAAQQRRVDILVNNAGFGLFGDFLASDWTRVDQMLQLDVVALVHLTRLLAEDMRLRGWGRILQIASTGAFQPTPSYAAYGAAKAFVLSFGVALNAELRGSGVSCTVLSPGVTATEFLQVSGQRATAYQRATRMDSPTVARIGIAALLRGDSARVSGWVNALMAWSTRFTPRPIAARLAQVLMKN